MTVKMFKSLFVGGSFALFALACGNSANTNNTISDKMAAVIFNNNSNLTTPAASPSAGDELAFSRQFYQETCAKCHGADGEGGERTFDGQKFKVPSYKNPRVVSHADSKYVETIANGEDEMPSFKDKLSADQINQMVKYIRKEFQGK